MVYPGHPVLVDTGLAFEVPWGYMLRIAPRSGLAFKHGVEAYLVQVPRVRFEVAEQLSLTDRGQGGVREHGAMTTLRADIARCHGHREMLESHKE